MIHNKDDHLSSSFIFKSPFLPWFTTRMTIYLQVSYSRAHFCPDSQQGWPFISRDSYTRAHFVLIHNKDDILSLKIHIQEPIFALIHNKDDLLSLKIHIQEPPLQWFTTRMTFHLQDSYLRAYFCPDSQHGWPFISKFHIQEPPLPWFTTRMSFISKFHIQEPIFALIQNQDELLSPRFHDQPFIYVNRLPSYVMT